MITATALLINQNSELTSHLNSLLDDLRIPLLVADDFRHCLSLASSVETSLLLLDFDQPLRPVLRLLSDLQSRGIEPAVLWMTRRIRPETIERFQAAGAKGIIEKRCSPQTLASAIRAVLSGNTYFPGLNTAPASPTSISLLESERLLLALRGPASS